MESAVSEIEEMDSQKKFIAGKLKAKALVLNDFHKQRNLRSGCQKPNVVFEHTEFHSPLMSGILLYQREVLP